MHSKLIALCLALLTLCAVCAGEGFTAYLLDDNFVLSTSCYGNIPLPDGTPVRIFVDGNNNGPDLSDVQPTVGGPLEPGTVDYNTFPMNGGSFFGQEGMFYTDPPFTSNGGVMLPVNRFYLRIDYPTIECPMVTWYSEVRNIPSPGPINLEFFGWYCLTFVPPFCFDEFCWLQPTNPNFPHDQNSRACIRMCREDNCISNGIYHIGVGPVSNPTNLPLLTILPGCNHSNTSCNEECAPAAGWLFDPSAWQWITIGSQSYFTNVIRLPSTGTSGCVCVHLDYILPVEFSTFTASPGDNSVALNWTTASETDLSYFEVLRNTELLVQVDPNSDRSYSYRDLRAVNGMHYSYKVAAVGVDGLRTESISLEATPDAALGIVIEYALHQNYPNPFNPSTSITFDVKERGVVSLAVYNLMGQRVALLSHRTYEAGRHNVNFDAANYPSGLYLYSVKIGNEFTDTKKMLLVK